MSNIHIPVHRKLSDADRIAIRRHFKTHKKTEEEMKIVGALYGVSHHTIVRVINGN